MDPYYLVSREFSTLSYILGTMQFCRDELQEIDADLSSDLEAVIAAIVRKLGPLEDLSQA